THRDCEKARKRASQLMEYATLPRRKRRGYDRCAVKSRERACIAIGRFVHGIAPELSLEPSSFEEFFVRHTVLGQQPKLLSTPLHIPWLHVGLLGHGIRELALRELLPEEDMAPLAARIAALHAVTFANAR